MSPKSKVGVIDYGGGNIRSLIQALEKLGTSPELVTSPEQLGPLSHLFFPGQGAFGDCMKKLRGLGLVEPIFEWIQQDKPFFGICVGYQLLFEDSEESPESKGLSVLEGKVVRFREEGIKVPHMGWNSLNIEKNNPLLSGLGEDPRFYFIHSYHIECKQPDEVLATTTYGYEFPSVIKKGNIMGAQFHPEKSHKFGIQFLKNFAAL